MPRKYLHYIKDASDWQLTQDMKAAREGRNVFDLANKYVITTYSGSINEEDQRLACDAIIEKITAERKRRREEKQNGETSDPG